MSVPICRCGRGAITHAELTSDRTRVEREMCEQCAAELRRKGEPRPVRIASKADPRSGRREFREG